MLSRCSVCHGKKQIVALGNMLKDCLVCKGIGWLKLDEVIAESAKVDEALTDKPVVKIDKRSKEYRNGRGKTDKIHA